MSNERIGLVVGAVVALVLAFVVLSPGDDDEPATPATPTAAAPATTAEAGDEQPQATTTVAPPPPAADFTTVRVRDGRPVGGVQTITVEQGERARIRVTSTDTSDEIHLHGYDEYANVAPGSPARFSFEADATGIFEIELHGTGTQIGRLVVEP